MKIIFRKQFQKQYHTLPQRMQNHFDERLRLLIEAPDHPLLRRHNLKGRLTPLESINITGDYRALFTDENDTLTFYRIGTHSELY